MYGVYEYYFCDCVVLLLFSDFCWYAEAGLRPYNINSLYPEELTVKLLVLSVGTILRQSICREIIYCEKVKPEIMYVDGNTSIGALKTTVRTEFSYTEIDLAAEYKLLFTTTYCRENLANQFITRLDRFALFLMNTLT